MNNIDNSYYSQMHANYQRNSYLAINISAKGTLNYKNDLYTKLERYVAPPITLYSCQDVIGIQANPKFVIFENGKYLKDYSVVVSSYEIAGFKPDFYYVTEYSGLVQFYKYDTSPFTEINDDITSGVSKWWFPLIIIKLDKGVLVVQQFIGGPQRKPKKFMIDYTIIGENLPEWGIEGKGEIANALLTSDHIKLLYSHNENFIIVNTSTGTEIKKFPHEMKSISSASLNLSDELVIYGINADSKNVLCSFDLEGNKLWEHELVKPIENNQPPVCGEDNTVFFISKMTLYAIKDGKLLWKEPVAGCTNPLMTVCKDNDIILQAGNHIKVFSNSGEQKFSVLISKNLKEEFSAAPVVGGDGFIYTASNEALYSFK